MTNFKTHFYSDKTLLLRMGAKNFGKKKESAKVKRAKRREKKLRALRLAGIINDNDGNATGGVHDNEENGVKMMEHWPFSLRVPTT